MRAPATLHARRALMLAASYARIIMAIELDMTRTQKDLFNAIMRVCQQRRGELWIFRAEIEGELGKSYNHTTLVKVIHAKALRAQMRQKGYAVMNPLYEEGEQT